MYLLKPLVILGIAVQSITAITYDKTNKCQNTYTDFTKGYGQWSEVTGAKSGFNITSQGLALSLEKPWKYVPLTDPNDGDLPYNNYSSPFAPTFQYKYMIHFGRVSYIMKTAGVSGAVTAGVIMSDATGDEIDYEMIGGKDSDIVQTNYFYGKNPVYNVNMATDHTASPTASTFHNYTVVWEPEVLKFYVDNKLIRTSYNNNKCDSAGNCEFPTHAGYVILNDKGSKKTLETKF